MVAAHVSEYRDAIKKANTALARWIKKYFCIVSLLVVDFSYWFLSINIILNKLAVMLSINIMQITYRL